VKFAGRLVIGVRWAQYVQRAGNLRRDGERPSTNVGSVIYGGGCSNVMTSSGAVGPGSTPLQCRGEQMTLYDLLG
jgi:hypothetical protein